MAAVDLVQGRHGARAILLDYRPYNEGNRLDEVRRGLKSKGVDTEEWSIVEYDRFDPRGYADSLHTAFKRCDARRGYVDVSTMSKLAIILTLGVCRELDIEVCVLYVEAETYGPSREEFDSARSNGEIHQPTLQIFTGVHGVVRVASLASVSMQGQPTAALVFMSFNDALTQVLLNTVYPSRLLLVNGRPPVHDWREYATAWIHEEVRREWESDNPTLDDGHGGVLPTRAVSTLDYRETVELLIELYWELSENHRILLAPSGSKMQALGCFFAKALHPDIHIEYPSPEGFLPEYSRGVGNKWVLQLGRLNALVGAIANRERSTYLELAL